MRSATTAELERALAGRLSRVRLVAEIGIDEALRTELADALTEIVHWRFRNPDDVSRNYPAILVCYMVAEGIYGYEAGAYFSHQSVREVGHTFARPTVEALRRLALEDFSDLVAQENARRYLTPILAHGGIPKYCLADFFTLLLRDLGRGVTDASDLLALWRTRKTRFQDIDKPVERFLLFGGGLALDLIDRCIDLVGEYARTGTIPSSASLGLPAYVVDAFAAMPQKMAASSLRTSTAYPRPRLVIDPWDPRGPTLELPPVPSSVVGAEWLVSGSDQLRRYRAVPAEPKVVLLRPARSWTCELRRGASLLRGTNFEGLDPVPSLFFDPADGRAVSVANGLRLAEAWILCPAGTDITAASNSGDGAAIELRSPQELPQPAGDWTGFSLRHVTLDGAGIVRIERPPEVHIVRVLSPQHHPRLSGEPVAGVATEDGVPVYAEIPAIALDRAGGVGAVQWRIRVRSGNRTSTVDAVELPADAAGVRIDSLLLGDGPRRVDLVVQGPLGSDLRAAFAVVPGLAVQRSARISCPGDQPESVKVAASHDVVFVDGQVAGPAVMVAEAIGDHVSCTVEGSDGERMVLRISVNRLMWGFTRSDDPATSLDQRVDMVHADELVDGVVDSLVVRTGVPGSRVRLLLRSLNGHLLQMDDEARTSGMDGRWIFDLARFRDSVRTSADPRLELLLVLDARPVRVAEVRAPLVLGPITAHARVEDDDSTTVMLEFEEGRVLRDRVARLWSLDRVWEGPISQLIADDRIGSAEIKCPAGLPAGPYLAEVAIDDGWSRPSRPRLGFPNTASAQIGTTGDWSARLRALERDDDPMATLEVAVVTGTIARSLRPAELSSISRAAFDAACEWIDRAVGDATTSPQFSAICDLLFADPACLARRIVEDVSGARHDPATILRFCIETVHRVHPLPAAEVDDGVMRGLWLAAPVLAAGLDIDMAPPADRAARCDEFLGWSPDEDPELIPPGEPATQAMMGAEAPQLEQILRSIELVPQQLLRLDALVAANFEWLLADKSGRAKPARWWSRTRWLVGGLDRLPDLVIRHLEARRPGSRCVEWAAFPEVTLAATIHVVTASAERAAAVRALIEAADFASSIVTRDLVLAIALLRTAVPKEMPA